MSGLLEDLPTLFKFPIAGWFFLRALVYRFGRVLGRTPTDQLLKLRVRRLRARRHWAVLFGVLLQTVGIVDGAFLLSRLVSGAAEGLWLAQSLLWYIAFFAVMRFGWHVLKWWVEILVVTDKELMIISGFVMSKVYVMPLGEVTDLSFMRPVGGRLLGYGTLRVESEAAGQVKTIKYLLRPEIIELIFGEEPPLADGQDNEDGV